MAQKNGQLREQYQLAFSHTMELSHSGAFHEDRNSVVAQNPYRALHHGRIPSRKSFCWKWASGNSEVLPNGPDQIRAPQLAISKGRFQRTQN